MRNIVIWLLITLAFLILTNAAKSEGPDGDENNEKKAQIIKTVRHLRKLIYNARHMNKEDSQEKMQQLRKQIQETVQKLEKHKIKWNEMNNQEKCDIDPEVASHVKKLEQIRNMHMKKSENEGEQLKQMNQHRERIMQALNKMHVEDEDLPKELRRQSKGEDNENTGKKEENQNKEQNRERIRERTRENAPDTGQSARKGAGHDSGSDLPELPDIPNKSQKAAKEALESQKRTRENEEKGQGKTERARKESQNKIEEARRNRNQSKEAYEKAKNEAEEAARARRRAGSGGGK